MAEEPKPRVPAEPVEPKEPATPAEPVAPVEPKEPVAPPKEPDEPKEPKEPVTPPVEPVIPPKEPQDDFSARQPKRPVAFIPLGKYHAEMREKDEKIAELEKLVPKKDQGPVADEASIQAYADKHGMEPEAVKDLLALLPKSDSGAKLAPEDLQEFNRIVSESKAQKAKDFETKDWQENAIPTIKELFPTATEEQIKAAQAHLDPIAHTAEGVNQKYSSIVFENRKELAKIFAAPAEPKDKATLEPGKTGAGSPSRLTTKDFDGDKPDFSLLEQLSPEDQRTITKGFVGETYKKYLVHVAQNQPLEVNRGGKKILLK